MWLVTIFSYANILFEKLLMAISSMVDYKPVACKKKECKPLRTIKAIYATFEKNQSV